MSKCISNKRWVAQQTKELKKIQLAVLGFTTGDSIGSVLKHLNNNHEKR